MPIADGDVSLQKMLNEKYTIKGLTATEKAQQSQIQITALNKKITLNKSTRNATQTAINNYKIAITAAAGNPTLQASLRAEMAPYVTLVATLNEEIAYAEGQISDIRANQRPLPASTLATSEKALATSVLTTIARTDATQITYNVGSVKEAYFKGTESFMKETLPRSGNTPVAVTNAANLWTGGLANKGMIQSWAPPGGNQSEYDDSQGIYGSSVKLPSYGFQFQYNPTNVVMNYLGAPAVDIAYQASGEDKFNFVGTGITQSTIGFQILVNRVYDQKYYGSDGLLTNQQPNLYAPSTPDFATQRAIYKKGTMYDVEFLLSTLLGIKMKSYLRGEDTADMGFVSAVPVELHLGQSLRYLVYINSLTVNHVLFNERMVPLFSTIDISCARLPDFANPSDTLSSSESKKETPTKTTIEGSFDWKSLSNTKRNVR